MFHCPRATNNAASNHPEDSPSHVYANVIFPCTYPLNERKIKLFNMERSLWVPFRDITLAGQEFSSKFRQHAASSAVNQVMMSLLPSCFHSVSPNAVCYIPGCCCNVASSIWSIADILPYTGDIPNNKMTGPWSTNFNKLRWQTAFNAVQLSATGTTQWNLTPKHKICAPRVQQWPVPSLSRDKQILPIKIKLNSAEAGVHWQRPSSKGIEPVYNVTPYLQSLLCNYLPYEICAKCGSWSPDLLLGLLKRSSQTEKAESQRS